jgi:hypothetical protein
MLGRKRHSTKTNKKHTTQAAKRAKGNPIGYQVRQVFSIMILIFDSLF